MVWTLINLKPLGILQPANFPLSMKISYSSSYLCSSLFESIHFVFPFFLSSFYACLKFFGTSNPYLYCGDTRKDCNFACFTNLSVSCDLFARRLSYFHPSSSSRSCFLAYIARSTGMSFINASRHSVDTAPVSQAVWT